MHKKVHGSSIYILLTYTYLNYRNFEGHFWIPSSSLPPSLHDQYARGVVVCCEDAVFYLACLLACLLITFLFACLLASFVGWSVGWLVGQLVGCLLTHLLACSLACLLAWLVGWLIACLLACLLGRLARLARLNTRNSTKQPLTASFG